MGYIKELVEEWFGKKKASEMVEDKHKNIDLELFKFITNTHIR